VLRGESEGEAAGETDSPCLGLWGLLLGVCQGWVRLGALCSAALAECKVEKLVLELIPASLGEQSRQHGFQMRHSSKPGPGLAQALVLLAEKLLQAVWKGCLWKQMP